jgi:hypothetical protein
MKKVYDITFIFILLPYIGISILPSDTQPFAVLFSLLSLVALDIMTSKTLLPKWIFPILVMSMLAIIAFLLSLFINDEISFLNSIRALYGYLTPLIISLFVYRYLKVYKDSNISKYADIVLIITFFGFLLNVLGLTEIIQIFVNRSIEGGLIETSRGLTSFYPEQSRISEQMGILLFIYILENKLTKKRIFALFTAGFLSFAGQFYIVILQIIISYTLAKIVTIKSLKSFILKRYVIGFFSSLLIISILINIEDFAFLLINLGFPSRGTTAFLNLLDSGINGLSSDRGALIKSSGVIFMLTSIVERPFSFEIFSIVTDFDSSYFDTFMKIQTFIFQNNSIAYGERVYSALGTWVVNFGLIGLIATISLIFKMYSPFRKIIEPKNFSIIFAIIFLSIILFLKIPLANPTIWLLYVLIQFRKEILNI